PCRRGISFCLATECGSRFPLKFFFAAAELAQAPERDSAEFAPGPCQRVGHIGHGNSMVLCQLLVGDFLVTFEVISFKQAEGALASARVAKLAQLLYSQTEQAAQPFLFEELFERFRRRDGPGIHHRATEFLFRGGKVQSHMGYVAAALLPPAGLI